MKNLIALVVMLLAAPPAFGQVVVNAPVAGIPAKGDTGATGAAGTNGTIQNGDTPKFGTAAASTNIYSNNIVATIPWDPTLGAGKTITSSTGYPTAGLFFTDFQPSATRTVRSIGLSNSTRATSGNFGASIRGYMNELDVVTTGTVGFATAFYNTLMTHGGGPTTATALTGTYTLVDTQGSMGATEAVGTESAIETDGPAIGTGIAFLGSVSNYGAGITNGYGVYIYESNAANKWAFYSEPGAGVAEISDGLKTPIVSYGSSSVLTISTNVIAPTSGVHHVGAGLVKTITVPASCSPTCTIAIVPDAAFTTDTTGNVGLASTATTGRLMIFAWDGTKWWPSY